MDNPLVSSDGVCFSTQRFNEKKKDTLAAETGENQFMYL
jgi:hypothetical protein